MDNVFPDEMRRVAARVRRLSASCPAGFWFLTDLHVPSNHGASPRLLERLFAETGLRTVVCGGDVPEAFGDRKSLDEAIARYRSEWVGTVERAGGEFFPIHGNHDFTIRANPVSECGFTYSAEKTRAMVLDTAAVRTLAVAHESSCAYFADLPASKMRLVVADCSDSVDPLRPFWGVRDGMSDTQVFWLAERALANVPDGWCVVVAGHEPVAGVGANGAERELFAPWRSVLEAYRARGTVSALGRSFDFSDAGGRLFLCLSGHHHAELQSCLAGLWHVTEPCDAAYLDYINRSKPWCANLPRKQAGTWAGQTFDAVQIDPDRGLAHFTRVGGGADRTLHAAGLDIRVGQSVRLSPSVLSGAVQWGAFDADHATSRANPERQYDYFTDYDSDVGSISADGLFMASAPGESVAVATGADGSREYFPLVVR